MQDHSEIQDHKEEVKDSGEVITLGPDRVKQEHYFELKRDRDNQLVAQCKDCPLGFPIGTEELRNGHIYIHNSLVI